MSSAPSREEILFQAAAALAGVERIAFLDRECAGDPALGERLEALLAAHDQPETLFGTQGAAVRPPITLDLANDPADDGVGQTLGRYKLLEKIGEGGCGVVYVAEQLEPVRRRVALKIIKLGMDTKQVVARFEAERQALAMMDHPNIAKVLDAGTTEGGKFEVRSSKLEGPRSKYEGSPNSDLRSSNSELPSSNSELRASIFPVPSGRPYFVMELVRGIRITDYCDQNRLTMKERLDLFIKVCQAIQHAHQKGIIHRDIKPSNILVTLHDGVPVPKVIDFGIAKATEGRLTDATVYTQLHQFIGTPAYMSPEQAEMSGLDMDTRSDIYSLGVLLYELLTGKTPFDAQELMASGLDAMRKTIREKEPLRPSTRLTQERAARRSEIRNQESDIDCDLDWIVMKCLEKDRGRRYETANGLAADLRRHLDNEPVVARPPSAVYRFQKAFRRNKLVFAAATSVALALIVGLGISTWQWRVAVRRGIAEAAAKRNEALERKNAESAYARVAELLCQLEIQKAEELFLANKPSQALAYLARVLREHPTIPAVADRVVSGLTQFNFAWPRPELLGHRDLRFSPDGQRFVTIPRDAQRFTVGGQRVVTMTNGAVQILDTVSGQPAAPPITPDAAVYFAEFSPDGRWLLTLSHRQDRTDEYEAQVWDSRAGSPASVPITSKARLLSAQLSPDGQRVITASPFSVQVWDVPSGRLLFHPIVVPKNAGSFTFARFSPDTSRILTTTDGPRTTDSGVQMWNLRTSGLQVWDPSKSRLESALSDNTGHASAGGGGLSPQADRWVTFTSHTVRTWDIASGRSLAAVSPGAAVSQVEFSPDGQRILTAAADRVVRIWDSGTGQPVGESLKHEARVLSARFSPNGQGVLTISADGIGRVWDAFTGRLWIDAFHLADSLGQFSQGLTADFSPDGRFVAVQFGVTLRMWELTMAPAVSAAVGKDRMAGRSHGAIGITAEQAHGFSGPPPEWFAGMVEAVAGQRLTQDRTLEPVSFGERLEFQARVVASAEDDPFARFGRWLLADLGRRRVSPFSATTLKEYVDEQIRQDTTRSLEEALRLSPANGLAMSRLAVHLAAQHPLKNPRRTAEAEYFSQRALELVPDEPSVWRMRGEVLARGDKLQAALQVNERATQRFPADPELWNQRGNLLERAAEFDQAEQAYSRAIALVQQGHGGDPERHARYLLNRSDALASLGHLGEAQAARQAGLSMLQTLSREDSPQWGGNDPGRNLYASATGLPKSLVLGGFLPDTEEVDLRATDGVRFVVPLGSQSFESPAVAQGKIFVGTNNDHPRDPRHQGDRSILLCLDERSGSFHWQLVVPKLASGKVNDWENLGLLSTPAIEGNRVYVVTTRCEVLCLTTDSLAKGNVGPFRNEGRYAAGPGNGNPEVELGPKDADIVWRYDMMHELGVFPHNGTRTHPLIVGDLLYVGTCNGMDWTHANIPSPRSPSLIALNKHTGELVGEDDAGISARIFHGQWSSPSTGRVGARQLVFFGGGDGFCYAFDAVPVHGADGPLLKKVWWADCNPPEYKTKNGAPVKYRDAHGPSEILATPVFWRDRVYVAIGQEPEHGEGVGNLLCLDATRTGDITGTGILWSYRGIKRSMSTAAITPEGLLFICDFSGFVHCVDAESGRPYWVHDMKAHIWGSTLVADGKVYVGDEDGDFVVFAATQEKKVLSSTFLDGVVADGPNLGAPMYSTPVAANGVVYFNTISHLFAIENASRGTGISSTAR